MAAGVMAVRAVLGLAGPRGEILGRDNRASLAYLSLRLILDLQCGHGVFP